jgi:hypothetical protein
MVGVTVAVKAGVTAGETGGAGDTVDAGATTWALAAGTGVAKEVIVAAGDTGADAGSAAGVARGAPQFEFNVTAPELEVEKWSEYQLFTVSEIVPDASAGSTCTRGVKEYGNVPRPPDPLPEAEMAEVCGVTVETPPVEEAT